MPNDDERRQRKQPEQQRTPISQGTAEASQNQLRPKPPQFANTRKRTKGIQPVASGYDLGDGQGGGREGGDGSEWDNEEGGGGGGRCKLVRKFQGWIVHPEFGEHPLPAQFELKKRLGKWRGKWSVLANEKFNGCAWARKALHEAIESFTEESDETWAATCHATAHEDAEFRFHCNPREIKNLEQLEGKFFVRPKEGTEYPTPVSSWDFSRDLQDHLDSMDVTLYGSARKDDAGLILDGGGFAVSEPVTERMTQKSLEVTIELDNLDQQQAVGVMSIGSMEEPTSEFDAIVYNQRGCKQWMSCSEFFRRSQVLGGQAESEKKLLHLVATYDETGSVTLFRNGRQYGNPYKAKCDFVEHAEGAARVVFGARHIWPSGDAAHALRPLPVGNTDHCRNYEMIGGYHGKIIRAALYDKALSSKQARLRARTGRFKLWLVGETWDCEDAAAYKRHLSSMFNEPVNIREAKDRAMSLAQLASWTRYATENCHRWRDSKKDNIMNMQRLNLYGLVHWLIKPATRETGFSFVELIAKGPQFPKWMISHWWGEPIIDFFRSVDRHVTLRSLSVAKDHYWICAYANRQHRLQESLSAKLEETSFFQAMKASEGVLCVLDSEATPFKRMWCAFEAYVALENIGQECDKQLLFDVVTVSNGMATILSDGLTMEDNHDNMPTLRKADREQEFPLAVIQLGLNYDIKDAKASEDTDKDRILEWMNAQGGGENAVSQRIKTFFAMRAWRQCVMQKQVDILQLHHVLKSDDRCEALEFDFSYLFEFRDQDLQRLCEGLPVNSLKRLKLNLEWCASLTNSGIKYLENAFSCCEQMQDVSLNLRECPRISSDCSKSLVSSLSKSLERIEIMFPKDSTDEDVATVADSLLEFQAAKHMHLNFHDCKKVASKSFCRLMGVLVDRVGITEVNFDGCSISDSDMRFLAGKISEIIPTGSDQEFSFSFKCKDITEVGAEGLVECLVRCMSLRKVRLALPFKDFLSTSEMSEWLFSKHSGLGQKPTSFASVLDLSNDGIVELSEWMHVMQSEEARLQGWQKIMFELAYRLLERCDLKQTFLDSGVPTKDAPALMRAISDHLAKDSSPSDFHTEQGSNAKIFHASNSVKRLSLTELLGGGNCDSARPQSAASAASSEHDSTPVALASTLQAMFKAHDHGNTGSLPVEKFRSCLKENSNLVNIDIDVVVRNFTTETASGEVDYQKFLLWLLL